MLPIKSKKDIERLYLEIDQITHQNKKYILHIAQLQEDLEDLMNLGTAAVETSCE